MKAFSRSFRSARILVGVSVFLFLLQLAGAIWLRHSAQTTRAQTIQLTRMNPAAVSAGGHANEAFLHGLERDFAELAEKAKSAAGRIVESELQNRPSSSSDPTALYFEIVATIERLRAEVTGAGIGIAPDLCFGFRTFVEARSIVLPEEAHFHSPKHPIAVLEVQLQDIDRILTAWIQAQPTRLIALEREAIEPQTSSNAMVDPETFRFDRSFTRLAPNLILSTAYRIEFQGRSASLRRFLEGVQSASPGFVIRRVDVRPAARADSVREDVTRIAARHPNRSQPASPFVGEAVPPTFGSSESPSSVVPVVGSNESVFTVVIESVLAGTPAGEGGAR